ncbi:hypothetical protein [Adonisia turfae]|uniref:Uncharacterized protein n=1 Tax=Adonisia turfae CCMR0081 TaxID=2292702 RepID=A0A6M0RGI0_9CYAN|nr:hypothetical protein [Adonisia turfae]NEZ55344.1 hypothetical protein [Adonisia turfae CCMR0081]
MITLDLALLIGLTSCADGVSDTVNSLTQAFRNDAVAVSQPAGLVAHSQGPSSEAFHMVGSSGQLTHQQTTTLLQLNWPQSHQAIEGALGHPHTRDTYADYYTLPNGHTATVYYSGGDATGYSLGDSGVE